MVKKYSDLGYAAGLFDAKGSLKIDNNLFVWITIDNFKVAEFLQEFGAVISKRSDGQFKAKWKNRNAYNFLCSIIPFLISKKDQAEVGIEFGEAKANKLDPAAYTEPLQRFLKILRKED